MYDDKSITKKEQDKLHRTNFSDLIVNTIKNIPTNSESIVIGVIGGWGTGKSTIINFCEADLNEIGIKVFRFNPWNYTSQNSLYSEFFDALISNLNLSKKIKNKLVKYKKRIMKNTLDILSLKYPFFSKFLGWFDESKEHTLDNLKKSLDNDLKDNERIVVIIDDIDRLIPGEIKLIFQIVKSLANFPNIVYILAFDEEYVNFALKDWNPRANYLHSEDFINKIVQVPIYIPKFNKNDFKEIFLDKYKKIIKNHKTDDSYVNKDKLYNLLEPFFNNVRDINRYCNSLNSYLYSIHKEINLFDFSLIIGLQLFSKEIYDVIKYGEEVITGSYLGHDSGSNISEYILKELENFSMKIFKNYNGDEVPVKNILKELFPKLRYLYAHTTTSQKTIDEKIMHGGVMFSDYFEFYFLYDTAKNIIPKSEFNKITNAMNNTEELYDSLLSFKDYPSAISVVYHLRFYASKFNEMQVFNLFKVIYSKYEELLNKRDGEPLSPNHFIAISEYLFDIINKSHFGKDTIVKYIENNDVNDFIVYFVWYSGEMNYFTESQKSKLDNKCSTYLKNLFNNFKIEKIKNSDSLMGIWKSFSKDNYFNEFINNLNDYKLLGLISKYKSFSEYSKEIKINYNDLNSIYNLNYLYNRFKELDKNKISDDDQLKFLELFLRNYYDNYKDQ